MCTRMIVAALTATNGKNTLLPVTRHPSPVTQPRTQRRIAGATGQRECIRLSYSLDIIAAALCAIIGAPFKRPIPCLQVSLAASWL